MTLSAPISKRVEILRSSERSLDFNAAMTVCTSKMSLPLYLAFWLADLVYAPQYKWEFLSLRLLIVPVNLWFNWRFSKNIASSLQVQMLSLIFAFFNGILITVMILVTDGASSVYYAGLNLVALGILSFFPWSKRFFVAAIASIFGPYYLGLLAVGVAESAVKPLYLNSFFILGTVIASMVIRWFNENLKGRELKSRIELSDRNLELDQALKELKTAEADLIQSEKMATLGTIAALLAHEINNSMHYSKVSIGAAEKIANGLSEEDKKKKLQTCLKLLSDGVDVTTSIIDNVRSYAGLTGAKIEMANLKDIVDSALKLLTLKIHNGSKSVINVKVNISKEIRFLSYPAGVYQIIVNLVSNAVDAMPNGGSLEISAEPSSGKCIITVKDSGCGIAPEVQEKIFLPFYTTKGAELGSGLGLYVVKKEIDRLKGSIAVNSTLGEGCVFIVSIRTDLKEINGELV